MKPKHQEYEGHRFELLEREGQPELLIDNVPVNFGRLPDGSYFLNDYAYDWSDDLLEVARRYIDYRERSTKIQDARKPRKEA